MYGVVFSLKYTLDSTVLSALIAALTVLTGWVVSHWQASRQNRRQAALARDERLQIAKREAFIEFGRAISEMCTHLDSILNLGKKTEPLPSSVNTAFNGLLMFGEQQTIASATRLVSHMDSLSLELQKWKVKYMKLEIDRKIVERDRDLLQKEIEKLMESLEGTERTHSLPVHRKRQELVKLREDLEGKLEQIVHIASSIHDCQLECLNWYLVNCKQFREAEVESLAGMRREIGLEFDHEAYVSLKGALDKKHHEELQLWIAQQKNDVALFENRHS